MRLSATLQGISPHRISLALRTQCGGRRSALFYPIFFRQNWTREEAGVVFAERVR